MSLFRFFSLLSQNRLVHDDRNPSVVNQNAPPDLDLIEPRAMIGGGVNNHLVGGIA